MGEDGRKRRIQLVWKSGSQMDVEDFHFFCNTVMKEQKVEHDCVGTAGTRWSTYAPVSL